MPNFRPARLAAALAAFALAASAHAATETWGGRELIVHAPARLPPAGRRALVVVLHGGLGNAQRIAASQAELALNLDAEADRDGFVVAYLNGAPVTRRLGPDFRGWNAGDCCGAPAADNVDDVGYVRSAVRDLTRRYGVDPARVYGIGHSNGAMMVQRLLCETDVLAAGVAVSGPLELPVETCPAARGRRVLAIHGAEDANVPVAGGRGRGLAGVAFASEDHARQVFLNSGATYDLQVVPGAPHWLTDIDAALQRTEGRTLQRKTAQFFGLAAGGS